MASLDERYRADYERVQTVRLLDSLRRAIPDEEYLRVREMACMGFMGPHAGHDEAAQQRAALSIVREELELIKEQFAVFFFFEPERVVDILTRLRARVEGIGEADPAQEHQEMVVAEGDGAAQNAQQQQQPDGQPQGGEQQPPPQQQQQQQPQQQLPSHEQHSPQHEEEVDGKGEEDEDQDNEGGEDDDDKEGRAPTIGDDDAAYQAGVLSPSGDSTHTANNAGSGCGSSNNNNDCGGDDTASHSDLFVGRLSGPVKHPVLPENNGLRGGERTRKATEDQREKEEAAEPAEERQGNNGKDRNNGAAASNKRKREGQQHHQQAELRRRKSSPEQRRGVETTRHASRSVDDDDGDNDGDAEYEDAEIGSSRPSSIASPSRRRGAPISDSDGDGGRGSGRDGGRTSATNEDAAETDTLAKVSDGGATSGSEDYGGGGGGGGGSGGGNMDFGLGGGGGGDDISGDDGGDFPDNDNYNDDDSHGDDQQAGAGRGGEASGAWRTAGGNGGAGLAGAAADRVAEETDSWKEGEDQGGQRGHTDNNNATSRSRSNSSSNGSSISSSGGGDDDEALAVIDNNKAVGQLFDGRKWRPPLKVAPVQLNFTEGPAGVLTVDRIGELEYLRSTAENLKLSVTDAFPDFGSLEDNEHGLSWENYGTMKRHCARLKVVIRVRRMDRDTKQVFYDEYLRATDDEIKAALEEDNADPSISVDLYKRAVPLFRSRQAALKEAAGRKKHKKAILADARVADGRR